MEIELYDSKLAGELGILHLSRLWSRSLRERYGMSNGDLLKNEWALDNVIYHGLNLPIEETIQYLYQIAPTLSEFEHWILEQNGGAIQRNVRDQINAMILGLVSGSGSIMAGNELPKILSEDEIEFWNANGYIVVHDVYSDNEIDVAAKAVWEYLKMDPEDPDTWYERSSDHGIMVQLFHHPVLDLLRRSTKLKAAFAQIWGTSDLLVSTDRVSFNPPERPGHEFPGPHLHWDVSLDPPIPFGVQGLIYLTDTEPEQGAFTCVPGFHTRIENWLSGLSFGADPRDEILKQFDAVPIAGKAGDLVIWHQALPHGSRPNLCTHPRIVQYVTMFPADASYAEKWK